MGIPGSANLLMLGGGAQAYEIEQSLRFNSADSAYLNRTFGSAGNRKTWTWSGWVKLGLLTSTRPLFAAYIGSGSTDNQFFSLYIENGLLRASGYSTAYLTSTAIHRDPSAWYHIVCAVDTTSATANDRIRFYVNGAQLTAFNSRSNPSQNADLGINQAAQHQLGQNGGFGSYFDGYLSEVNFIDGSALDPEDFGEYDDSGVWRPIQYAGSYTGNSFYLKFQSSGIGTDSSGLSNTWTANNFTTSGTGTDVMSDTPTNNFATVSPLNVNVSNVLSDGNLTLNLNSSVAYKPTSTIAIPSSGKFYFEGTIQGGNSQTAPDRAHYFGLNESFPGSFSTKLIGWFSQGSPQIFTGSGSTSGASGSGFVNGDVLQCAVDATTGKVWMGRNNTWYSTAANTNGDPAGGTNESATLVAGTQYHSFTSLGLDSGVTGGYYINFGQRPFAYTPPSGFNTLSTANLPTPDIADGSQYFNTVTYTGTANSPGSTQSVSGVGFAPDLVWIKRRENANSHHWTDIVRGAAKYIQSNVTDAEVTTNVNGNLSSFDSDGFTCTYGSSVGSLTCQNGGSYVAWCWDAGGSGSSNTAGSITSTVSANPSAGFSIVSYTGTLSGTPGTMPTVGHGLGVTPQLVISKSRNNGGIESGNWFVWHASAGTGNWLRLNTTAAAASISASGGGTMVAPTDTVFSTPYISGSNISGATYVAYCFTEVEGYSKFGSFAGNSSTDGSFVHLGFKPSWLLVKRYSTTGAWFLMDAARNTYNVVDNFLYPNSSDAENSGSYSEAIDFLSNGFKCRTTSGFLNGSGDSYIFAAFSEHPFGGSGVSPATAR